MAYVGIDFHKRNTYVTRMDEEGNITLQQNLRNEPAILEDFVDSLSKKDKVVLEATGNWYHFYELVEEKACQVVLSHPAKTKAIASARIKNDKIDSKMLAHLLRCDLIPSAHLPGRAIRDTREILRYRASLVSIRTSLMNRVHAILSKNGILCPYSHIFGKKATSWLSSLSLRPSYKKALDGYLQVASSLREEIEEVEKEIKRLAEEDERALLLMTMPGISYYSALLVLSEIGEIERFPSAGQLCSYAGLVPSVYSSGGITRTGRITKTGSTYLRWILNENAMHAVKGAYRFEALYRRVAHRSGKNAAKTAVARKMLVCIFYMLKRNEPFRDIKPHTKKRTRAGKLARVIA